MLLGQSWRVCYFTSWSQDRHGAARYTVADVDPFLCTHLIYAFVSFDLQGNLDPNTGLNESKTYAEFNALKQQNPELKTLIAVGGWGFGSSVFSSMAANSRARGNFIKSAVAFLRQYGFDGLDLDWEYPGQRGGSAADKENFVLLFKKLHHAFKSELISGKKGLILSAAVAASRYAMDVSYDIPALDRYLDLWNLMTYDYHGAWDGITGYNSPLYPGSQEPLAQRTFNVEWTVSEYVRRGASKHKVMVGLPTYGRSFRLKSTSLRVAGAPATVGPAAPYTQEPGFWAYHEVCKKISESSGVVIRDVEQRVPYYVEGDLWISFDDVISIKEKISWLKQNGYGGYMTWALDMDVFNPALCPSVSSPYPLLTAANSVLLESSELRTTAGLDVPTIAPTISIVISPGPSRGNQGFSCAGLPEGPLIIDPGRPCGFVVCWAGIPFYTACPSSLVFRVDLGVCYWPEGPTARC